MSEVTRILNELDNGSLDSTSRLMPAVYNELRVMAAAKISNEKPGQTLNATGLVHEAWMRLAGNQTFESRRHFFGAAAEAMRRILIDRARARKAGKRGGGAVQIDIEPDQLISESTENDKLEALDIALEKFEAIEPEKSELVKMRYFAGLSIREAAEILGISTATADRQWVYAKAWLQAEVDSADG
jgi:RNA polymerase sigma factor (TIGR02999 family)